ncbi:MAG: LPXTG cell wall anchor domain-containing protein [Lachnospiraceae bacterium]
MQKLVREYLNEMKSRQKKRRRTGIAAILLIVMVVGGVIGVLTQYGVAMTGNAKCKMDEHQHSEACYSSETTCGLQEQAGHTHTDACYQTETTLVCTEEEDAGHTHTDDCYTEDGSLVCGQEESEGHTHTDGCYQTDSVLVCGQEEREGHTHTEDCTQSQITCGKEEHTHTDQCYIDTEAGVEDASVWEAQYKDVDWKDAWGEDLVTAAQKQIGYKENADNYTVAEDGSRKGYTRYGQFAGDVYADWDAAFVNFCMYYVGMKESDLFPDETDTEKWCEEYKRIHEQNAEYQNCLIPAKGYMPEAGDIIFFEKEDEETRMQMGIVSSYNKEKDEIKVIEGNVENEVKENQYKTSDNQITSYLKVAEIEKSYKGMEDTENGDAPQSEGEDDNDVPVIYDVNGIVPAAENDETGETAPERKPQREPAVVHVPDSTNGTIELRLYYGSEDAGAVTSKYPDGYTNNAHWGASGLPGYFMIIPKNIEGNLKLGEAVMTIHIPKKFIRKDSVRFSELGDNENMVPLEVEEDDDYYQLKMKFPKLDSGTNMGLVFNMSYVGGLMPAGYELPVYATLEYTSPDGETVRDDTGVNTYHPTYYKPELVKYANTNENDNEEMAKDGVMIAATVNGNQIVEDSDYASFWYNLKTDPWFLREYRQIDLTDTLPTYKKAVKDENGKVTEVEAIAQFDPEANPDWEVIERNSEGIPTKVRYKPITTDFTCAKEEGQHWGAALKLRDQLKQAELKLKFPGCIIDEPTADEKFLKKELTNHAEIECYPNRPGDNEQNDIVADDLKFVLTNQPVGLGLAKYNSANVVRDTKPVREGLYRWGIKVTNETDPMPFRDVVITDTELDNRLKLNKLQVEEKDYQNIKKVIAKRADGTEEVYMKLDFTQSTKDAGWGDSNKSCWELDLASDGVFEQFKIYMNDGKDEEGNETEGVGNYQLNKGEGIEIAVYSTFKEPDKSHFVDGEENKSKNVYHNGAVVEYWRGNTHVTGTTGNDFMLQEMTEDVRIEKVAAYGENISLGETKFWFMRIKGSLIDEKDYEDLKVVDMLPEGMAIETKDGKYTGGYGTGGEYVRDAEVIQNYNGLGRTAIIFHLDTEEVKKALDGRKGNQENGAQFSFKTTIPKTNAVEGLYVNYAYLHSEELEEITNETTAPVTKDIYGIAGKPGEKMIRYGNASGIIGNYDATYLEKWIAPEGSNAWLKKEKLPMAIGESFQYRLDIVNGSANTIKGVKAYDVLPETDDKNISNTGGRGSEYTVRLKGPLDDNADFQGYTVSYTTSKEVYTETMAEIMTGEEYQGIWLSKDDVSDWNEVTAFKIVSGEKEIGTKQRVQFVIPVKVTDVLSEESKARLEKKESEDQASGTVTYLEATNSFGYSVGNFSASESSNQESNYVTARIPFAGFVMKKVDSENRDVALCGAQFKLEKEEDGGEWKTVGMKETDENGIISFKNLVKGKYQLTEMKSPEGYSLIQQPICVVISQDPVSKEYTVVMEGRGDDDGSGTSKDPFIVVNWKSYELPSTGGSGIYWYMFGGMLLMMAAALITYRNKCKEVLRG